MPISPFTPKQLGWKRRIDLETQFAPPRCKVWELHNGRLFISPPGKVIIQVFDADD